MAFKPKEGVTRLEDLNPGDHIHTINWKTKYGLRRHMIVIDIDLVKQEVLVVHYDKPSGSVITSLEQFTFYEPSIKRMIYDSNDRFPAWETVRRAKLAVGMEDKELPFVPGRFTPSLYSASYHFAVLCVHGVRMDTKGWPQMVDRTQITSIYHLQSGDHLEIERCLGLYCHHVIVESVQLGQDNSVTVIHRTKDDENKFTIERKTYNDGHQGLDVSSGHVYRVNYDENPSYDVNVVIGRATLMIGKKGYNVFQKNCEHFARWCKTGENTSSQVVNLGAKTKQFLQPLSMIQALGDFGKYAHSQRELLWKNRISTDQYHINLCLYAGQNALSGIFKLVIAQAILSNIP